MWAGTMTHRSSRCKGLVVPCIRCESERTRRDGHTRLGGQRWWCCDCGRRFTARSSSAFSQHGFPDDVIAVAVRHSVRSRLSYADGVRGSRSAASLFIAARSSAGCSACSCCLGKRRVRTDDPWEQHGGWMNEMSASLDGGPMSSGQSIRTARSSMPPSQSGATPWRHRPSSSVLSTRPALRPSGWLATQPRGIRWRCATSCHSVAPDLSVGEQLAGA